jgi:hypothetical protein
MKTTRKPLDPDARYQAHLASAMRILSFDPANLRLPSLDLTYAEIRSGDLRNAARLYCGIINEIGPRRAPEGRFRDRQSMEDAIRDLAAPRFEGPAVPVPWLLGTAADGRARYHLDSVFGLQRLAGPNPTAIVRVTRDRRPGLPLASIRTPAPLSDAEFQRALAHHDPVWSGSLDQALDEGRVFVVDHGGYPTIAPDLGATHGWLVPAVALFYSHSALGLLPVGISLGGNWVLPGDSSWSSARLAFQNSDLVNHQLVQHLANTHLVLRKADEICTRSLPSEHVFSWLLAPHLDNVTVNVRIGEQILLSEGGMVESILGPPLEASRRIWEEAEAAWSLAQLDPAADVARRGCDDAETLPFYPYRDHGLPVWRGIRDYVEAVLMHGNERRVLWEKHPATADWFEAVIRGFGPRRGEGLGGSDSEKLTNLLAGFIFLSSAHHSAISYSQADHSLVVSDTPGTLLSDPRSGTQPEALLPGIERFAAQVEALWLLSSRRFRRLTALPTERGRAADRPFLHKRPEFNEERVRFNQRMLNLDDRLRGGLASQPLPNDCLLPSRISASASI